LLCQIKTLDGNIVLFDPIDISGKTDQFLVYVGTASA
jgi:hypothetical protein